MFTNDYLKWIYPLLDFQEKRILLEHTKLQGACLKIKGWNKVLEKYGVPHRKLKKIRKKLHVLTHLYELELLAFRSD